MFNQIKSMVGVARNQAVKAQGMVEYGLIIALVAVVAIAGLIILGPAISNLLSGLSASI